MDKPQKASTNANFSKTTSLQGRCRGSYPIRKCSRKESQDNRQGGRSVPTEPSEDDVRSRLGAYELEAFHRKASTHSKAGLRSKLTVNPNRRSSYSDLVSGSCCGKRAKGTQGVQGSYSSGIRQDRTPERRAKMGRFQEAAAAKKR